MVDISRQPKSIIKINDLHAHLGFLLFISRFDTKMRSFTIHNPAMDLGAIFWHVFYILMFQKPIEHDILLRYQIIACFVEKINFKPFCMKECVI